MSQDFQLGTQISDREHHTLQTLELLGSGDVPKEEPREGGEAPRVCKQASVSCGQLKREDDAGDRMVGEKFSPYMMQKCDKVWFIELNM